MKKLLYLSLLFILIGCKSNNVQETKPVQKITKTEDEWRNILTPAQFNILHEAGTELAFSHPYNDNKSDGTYVCAACNTPLYLSKYKYDSGSGWPSFDRAIQKNVELDVDYKIGYARTELKCKTCGGHLGHSFEDGPSNTTGKRHCINGTALLFIPKKSN